MLRKYFISIFSDVLNINFDINFEKSLYGCFIVALTKGKSIRFPIKDPILCLFLIIFSKLS